VLFVTHDIDAALFPSDVVVMTPRAPDGSSRRSWLTSRARADPMS
jgi:ABC-type nitrate/sulfonate/bicarbonate transport system ATPase subunit